MNVRVDLVALLFLVASLFPTPYADVFLRAAIVALCVNPMPVYREDLAEWLRADAASSRRPGR